MADRLSASASLPSICPDATKRRVAYFFEPSIGDYSYGDEHPMKPNCIVMADNLITHYGLLDSMEVHRPTPASREAITQFHDPDYVNFLASVSPEIVQDYYTHSRNLKRFHVGGRGDCPAFEGVFDFCGASAGGSIGCAAILNLGNADIALNWSSGLHHAKKCEASGFCYVNDIVLGILELLIRT
ncbi:hypothetical protein IFM89_006995 [Coptis chinensis]|uniref:Histone deacetylase domain-containing protein n=1 Tax=Coptis chinensis TaxID=261450 RepID=A0A835M507_9MAGN|nr:hypothetical protein IFM89_006995 [Coptis chinensis]